MCPVRCRCCFWCITHDKLTKVKHIRPLFATMVQSIAGDLSKLCWHFTLRRSPMYSLLPLLLSFFNFYYYFFLLLFDTSITLLRLFFQVCFACLFVCCFYFSNWCFSNLANTIAVCSCTRCRCGQLKLIKLPIFFKMGTLWDFQTV